MRNVFFFPILAVLLATGAWPAGVEVAVAEVGAVLTGESISSATVSHSRSHTHPEDRTPSVVSAVSSEHAKASQEVYVSAPSAYLLTLEEAINRALDANRGILDARDGVERARLSIVSAESEFELKFIPLTEVGFIDGSEEGTEGSFGAGVAIEKKFATGTFVTLEPTVTKTGKTHRSRVGTSLSQPLLRGLDREFNLSGVRGAEFGARSARRSLYLTRVDTILSTVRAVYAVTLQRKLTLVNEESFSRLNLHAEAARVKEKFGLATPIDIYRAELQLKQAEDNLTTAREAYLNALDALKVILALPIDAEIEVSAPLEYSIIRTEEKEAMAAALQKRVELKQAWDTVRDAERRSGVAKHGILPELDVVLSFAPFGSRDEFAADLNEYVWGISLSSGTDIRRTRERAAYEQSVLDVEFVRRNMTLLRDEITREAKSAVRALNEVEQRIEIQKEQIKTAEKKLKLAQVKFKHGMANNFDLIEAEEQLRQAQTKMISFVIDYIVGTYNLRAAMGNLLEQEAGL